MGNIKTKAMIDGKEVIITLTKEQLQDITRQTSGKLSVEDINTIEDAEKVLENCDFHIKCELSQFCRPKDWYSYQLETIIKAVNYIDNNYNQYKHDFDNTDIYKYIPYFKKTGSGWVVYCVNAYYYRSHCSVTLYFKNKETANLITNKFLSLYNNYITG